MDHLYLFQREPGWIVPKGDRDFTPAERAAYQSTLRRRITRWKAAYQLEKNQIGGAIHRPGTKINGIARTTVPDVH